MRMISFSFGSVFLLHMFRMTPLITHWLFAPLSLWLKPGFCRLLLLLSFLIFPVQSEAILEKAVLHSLKNASALLRALGTLNDGAIEQRVLLSSTSALILFVGKKCQGLGFKQCNHRHNSLAPFVAMHQEGHFPIRP